MLKKPWVMFEDTSVLEVIVELSDDIVDIGESKPATAVLPVHDVYIPEDALEIITQAFEGPLDLLLYLIRKNQFDVRDIPVAEVAEQYAHYIEIMQTIQLELAGEYLAMAATLAHIKSRLLLPPVEVDAEEDEEDDPRLELARRLEIYEQIRNVAQLIEKRWRVGRDIFVAHAHGENLAPTVTFRQLDLPDLVDAFVELLKQAELTSPIRLDRPTLFVKDQIEMIIRKMKEKGQMRFDQLLNLNDGRDILVVNFLALLDLINTNRIYAVQAEPGSPIHLKWNES